MTLAALVSSSVMEAAGDQRGGIDGREGVGPPGLHVRRDRPAAGPGLADGQALFGDRRAAGLPAQADAEQVGRVQAVDRSVAGGHAGAFGDPDPSGPRARLRLRGWLQHRPPLRRTLPTAPDTAPGAAL